MTIAFRAPALAPVMVFAAALTGAPSLAAQRAAAVGEGRTLMAQATGALRQGDTVTALAIMRQAAERWPWSIQHQSRVGWMAASQGQADIALPALSRLTAWGVDWSPANRVYAPIANDPRFVALRDSLTRATAPIARSTVALTLPDSLQHPEGAAIDATTGRTFVSSIRWHKVVVADARGAVRDFSTARLDAVFGMVVDAKRQRLWLVTTTVPQQEGVDSAGLWRSALVALDLRSGAEVGRWTPAEAGPHAFGDLTLAPDGIVWVSDSRQPTIYRLDPAAKAPRLEVGLTSPEWVSMQGLAFDERGARLWVGDWTTGLFMVDMATKRVTPVEGGPGQYLLGIDGLYRTGPRTLVAIENSVAPARVVRIDLDEAGTRVTGYEVVDRNLPVAESPTLGTLTPAGLLYVANSPWDYYDPAGRIPPGTAIPRSVLLLVPMSALR